MAATVDDIRTDLREAMRSGDTSRRDALRLIVSALDNARIEAGHDLSEDETMRVLQREAKQRRDSIAEYQKANRDDLVATERRELEVIEEMLPAQLSREEVRTIAQQTIEEVGATGPGDVGSVMRPLMDRLAGRADGRTANEIVRELLAG